MEPKYKPAGKFAKRFANIGLLVSGWPAFLTGFIGLYSIPDGVPRCGLEFLGDLCLMVFFAPLSALVGAVVGWFVGGILDRKRDLD